MIEDDEAVPTTGDAMLARAQGCLLGQLVGDALGAQVEFMSGAAIHAKFPVGVRELRDGGTWNLLAGQPTDDSEMALMLARKLVQVRVYSADALRGGYLEWLRSDPFDVGNTVSSSLAGRPNPSSQANGALMRISPVGIFGATLPLTEVAEMARTDASLTHIHRNCVEANMLYAMLIASAIRKPSEPQDLYARLLDWSSEFAIGEDVRAWVSGAGAEPAPAPEENQGWVRIAFWNALYQMLHAPDVEQGIVDTIALGGDTDTNAAIAGALLGAVHGLAAIPERWVRVVLACRPEQGLPGVRRPRPAVYWPGDALELAENLLRAGQQSSAQARP